jgi:hypothetical protein
MYTVYYSEDDKLYLDTGILLPFDGFLEDFFLRELSYCV